MSDKVVHVTSEVHARLMDFCKRNKIAANKWVSSLIDTTISNSDRGIQPVCKKELPKIIVNKDEEIWSRPPFWNGNNG